MLDVPLFNILRRSQTIFILLLDVFLYNRKPQWLTVFAVIVIFTGSVITSIGDDNSSKLGIIVAIIAVIIFALQLQEANRIGNMTDIKINLLELNL